MAARVQPEVELIFRSGAVFGSEPATAVAVAGERIADLAVLDRDPTAGPLTEIGAARAVQTWVGGRPVYCA